MQKNTIVTFILLLAAAPFFSHAQNPVEKVNNTTERVNNTIDKVGSLFKKKNKNKKDSAATAPSTKTNTDGNAADTKKITIHSTYGFVPGDSVLFEDHFTYPTGGFPDRWSTNSSGEVVTLDQYPGKWLSMANKGMYIPKLKGGLPKNFTIEFDMIIANSNNNHTFLIDFEDALNGNFDPYPGNPYVQFRIYEGGGAYVDSKAQNLSTHVRSTAYNGGGKVNHIAIRKEGERLQVFINEEKTFDINQAFETKRTYSTFKFSADFFDPTHFLVSNVKIAWLK